MRIHAKEQENAGKAYVRTDVSAEGFSKESEKGKKKEKEGSIYAGDLNLLQGDRIADKKVKAQRDAMKALLGQFSSDREIDDGLKRRSENIEKMQEICKSAQKEMREIDAHKEELRESYGVGADSEEQKDLEVLIKQRKAFKPGSGVSLTKEENERLKNMGPLTEYQQGALALEKGKGLWEEEFSTAQKTIKEEVYIIKEVKKELLKLHGMVDARNEADEILKNASKEMIGMLADEVKEHMDEQMEEVEEKAEEKAKEIRREKDGLDEFIQTVNVIKEQEQLLEEDIKGLLMDTLV